MEDSKPNDPFWLNDPKVIVKNFVIIPDQNMTDAERLNALTRLLIVICIGLYACGYKEWTTVFVLGLVLIIVLRNAKNEGFAPRRGRHDPCNTCGFDSTLPYINSKYETTPMNQWSHTNDGLRSYTHAHYKVIPVDTPAPYREVWRKDSKWCNEYSQYPSSFVMLSQPGPKNNQPQNKCHYEDRTYVDVLPQASCQKRQPTMQMSQPAFMRDSQEFRNNIMGEIVDQFGRRTQHNCVGFKPGRKTF